MKWVSKLKRALLVGALGMRVSNHCGESRFVEHRVRPTRAYFVYSCHRLVVLALPGLRLVPDGRTERGRRTNADMGLFGGCRVVGEQNMPRPSRSSESFERIPKWKRVVVAGVLGARLVFSVVAS